MAGRIPVAGILAIAFLTGTARAEVSLSRESTGHVTATSVTAYERIALQITRWRVARCLTGNGLEAYATSLSGVSGDVPGSGLSKPSP